MKKTIDKIFIGSLIFFLVFFALELVKEGFVSNYFDLNIVLLIVVIFGIISLILRGCHPDDPPKFL
jgi:hypothetical protein